MPQNEPVNETYHQYLAGGGEMGTLTRQFDWSASAIGHPATWPQNLLTTVSMLLNSRFPMFLFWGPQLIQFYNDGYRPSLGNEGKHPKALGQRGEDCWPEIWPVIKPLIDQVITTGVATWSEDQLIPIYRNNRLEDVYWTFSYSKIVGDAGNAGGVLVICSETTEKVLAYKANEDAKRELQFAIEAAELGTWDLDPLSNRFIGNNRLKSWFGLPPEEEIDLADAVAAMAENDRERVTEAIQNAMKKGSDGNYNIVYNIINRKNKVERTVKAVGKAKFDEEGNAYRFSGTLEDVTEEYLLQQRKDEFLSIASHELKTPLTSLRASMQILQKLVKTDLTSDKLPFFVDKANNSLGKLLYLIDDLMNVSKIQHGQLSLNKTRINLVELVRECSEHVRMHDSYQLVISGDKELFIDADYRRLDQVVVNLLNNALKYSPKSTRIEIHIGHDGKDARVSVQDFGIGISPEKLPYLFDRYYRVDAMGVQFSGLGLGLYISAEIVRRHDGSIGVESVSGEGSTFWFTLPLNS